MTIKQLQKLGLDFAPLTIAEAVLVQTHNGIERLDTVLNRKIEHITSDELTVTLTGPTVVIAHKNVVTAVPTPQHVKVAFDASGHITGALLVSPLTIKVFGLEYAKYNGNKDEQLNLGDDFEFGGDNKDIRIRWNTINK